MDEEQVFKALADESRRKLLDLLHNRDGQTLTELEAQFEMSRFGVMKHLQILEEASLVTTRKVGREKFHYLNPVPIQLVYDRWVSKYAQPWTQTLSALKAVMEDNRMTEKPNHVFQVYIRTTPEKLWQAITDPAFTAQYYFNTRVESTWVPGAAYINRLADGTPMVAGEVVECDPPRRLVTTFRPVWVEGPDGNHSSHVVYEIEPVGTACKLTLTHSGLDPQNPLTQGLWEGWSHILSGLKTYLETGEPLIIEDADDV